MSNCGDYTKVLPISGGEGNQGNFYIKTLDKEHVQTVVCGNTSVSMIKHGEQVREYFFKDFEPCLLLRSQQVKHTVSV